MATSSYCFRYMFSGHEEDRARLLVHIMPNLLDFGKIGDCMRNGASGDSEVVVEGLYRRLGGLAYGWDGMG
jgi:hypothetical protein